MLNTLKKLNFLINKRQRKGLVILVVLLFFGMTLEIFGLGILIPVISILLDPEIVERTPLLLSIRGVFAQFSNQSFIYLFLIAIVIVYFLKSLFIVFLTYKQNRFLANITADISNNLFSSYLSQPYSFHLKRNASELIKNIHVEINLLNAFLVSLITIFIESGFVFSVLVTLVYLEPFGAICIGFFYGFLSLIFLKITKRKLATWGKLRQSVDNQISKIALESLGGIKDLLILGKTSFFKEEFSKKTRIKARLNSNQVTLSQIPRFYLELISIVGLVSFIILLLFQEKDAKSLVAVLGVFVAATFRIIPSLNRIIASTQLIKFYLPSVDTIHNEIKAFTQNTDFLKLAENFIFNDNIEFKKVNFNFIHDNSVLIDISLQIKRGQIIGIIGESGSGKSTFVDLLLGLHKPTTGQILIDGIIGFQLNQSWRSNIGYVSQSIFLTDDSIENNIALGIPKNKIEKTRIAEVLKQVQLEQFINNLKFGVNTKVGERGVQLSGGQRQRIGIARALYHDPDILVLDEATSALDIKTENEVMKSINDLKKGKTIIIIAHRLSTIENCDLIYEIKDNRIKISNTQNLE